MMNIACILGIHDWTYDSTVVRSCGSELEKVYYCSRCRKQRFIGCDTTASGCENFKFPTCKYHPNNIDEECPKMK